MTSKIKYKKKTVDGVPYFGSPGIFGLETFGLTKTLGNKPTLDVAADTLLKFYLISKSNNDTLQNEYPLNKRLLHAA